MDIRVMERAIMRKRRTKRRTDALDRRKPIDMGYKQSSQSRMTNAQNEMQWKSEAAARGITIAQLLVEKMSD
jgi:hypothetical protein